jgi:hypothetical protein
MRSSISSQGTPMDDAGLATATYWASLLGTIADWAFGLTVVFLAIQLVSGQIAKRFQKQIDAAKDLRIAELDNETAKLRKQVAPRLITQAQQNDLTATLAKFKSQRGTVIASPSTPESEWFARVLTAPLKEAGWQMEILPGTATATVLFPSGVVVKYPIDLSKPNLLPENTELAAPAVALIEKLKEYGISSTATPGLVKPPNTIEIVISAR